jgi:hypothetical protein
VLVIVMVYANEKRSREGSDCSGRKRLTARMLNWYCGSLTVFKLL